MENMQWKWLESMQQQKWTLLGSSRCMAEVDAILDQQLTWIGWDQESLLKQMQSSSSSSVSGHNRWELANEEAVAERAKPLVTHAFFWMSPRYTKYETLQIMMVISVKVQLNYCMKREFYNFWAVKILERSGSLTCEGDLLNSMWSTGRW